MTLSANGRLEQKEGLTVFWIRGWPEPYLIALPPKRTTDEQRIDAVVNYAATPLKLQNLHGR